MRSELILILFLNKSAFLAISIAFKDAAAILGLADEVKINPGAKLLINQ